MHIIFLSILIAPVLLFAQDAQATSPILLSEVQIAGASSADEFIELYNTSDSAVDLGGWSLRKKTKTDITPKGSSIKTFSNGTTVPAHGYFLWANSQGQYATLADVTTTTSLASDNSLALFEGDVSRDALTWGTGHTQPYPGAILENPAPSESFTREFVSLVWHKTSGLTPTNSHHESYDFTPTPVITTDTKIRINEVLPNPDTKGDTGEFIELYNFGDVTVDLSGWIIHDATKTGKYIFPSGTKLDKQTYLLLTDKDFTFSLNNTDETLTLFDTLGAIVSSVQYAKTKEGVSLNFIDGKLRGSRTPTPGAANSLNSDPATSERVPKKGYKGFALEFRARGHDQDGDTLKYTWDFGDGHKSYKEKTTHKYLKTGKYTILLITDDGIDTVTETFEIAIQKYEPPELRITALLPNPKGTDTENEWIEIENHEKKAVNLKGFSIATGTKSKKLTNHPIREDFSIAGKSKKRITRKDSLFTLGNEKGFVELRAPDDKVIVKLKYKFEKSFPDNALLKKEKGKALELEISEPQESVPSSEDSQIIPETTPSNTNELPLEENLLEQTPEEKKEDSPAPSLGAVLGASTETPMTEETGSDLPSSTMQFQRWQSLGLAWIEKLNAKLNQLFLVWQ